MENVKAQKAYAPVFLNLKKGCYNRL